MQLVYHHSENLIGLVDKIDDPPKNICLLQLGNNDSKNSIAIAVNAETTLKKRNDLTPTFKN